MNSQNEKEHMVNNLLLRTISSIFLGGMILGTIALGGIFFQSLMAVFLVAMLYEWFSINSNKKSLVYVLGNIYILIPMLFWICNIKHCVNSIMLFYVFIIVWSCDVFAYLGGRLLKGPLKGPKLAPKISPNKTWSGVFSGFICAFIISHLYMWSINERLASPCEIIESVIFILASILGDLLESKVKRILNVKDSGNIIPGHGGFCDRFDSFLLVSYVLMIIKLT